jgi:hypothetical protein
MKQCILTRKTLFHFKKRHHNDVILERVEVTPRACMSLNAFLFMLFSQLSAFYYPSDINTNNHVHIILFP